MPKTKGEPKQTSPSKHIKSSTKADSMTLGAKTKSRFTTRLSVRFDPATKKAVLAFARESGLSLCQIYDALTKAFLHGVSVKEGLGTNSPTINLTIERRVKRIRRYSREVDADDNNNRYCCLKDRYFMLDELPNPYCLKCPNVRCRSSILKIEEGIINK